MNKRIFLLIYIGIFLTCMYVGGIVFESVIVGVATLVSFIVIVEASSFVKWCVAHTSYLIDIAIFIFAVYAKIHFGVTIALGLMFAGLGYSILYAPYLKQTYKSK